MSAESYLAGGSTKSERMEEERKGKERKGRKGKERIGKESAPSAERM